MQEKQAFRHALLEKRASITAEQRTDLDRAIVERIAASNLFRNASEILLYAPIRGEINLLPLVEIAQQMGKPVSFPRCNTESNTLTFHRLESNTMLEIGAYHIPEPPESAPVSHPDEHALCIVPALTFDPTGARLGYGKGYYDRFLATFPGVCIGAVYESLLVRKIPTEPHDLPVSYVFTERGICKCQQPQSKSKVDRPKTEKAEKPAVSALLARISERLSPKKSVAVTSADAQADTPKAAAVRALHAPAILVAVTFVLLLLSRLIDTRLTNRDNEYVVVILLQLLIFLVPAVIYGKLRGEAFSKRIRMSPPRPEHLWFTFCMLIVMIGAGLLCGIITGGISSMTGNFTLYNTFVARLNGNTLETIYIILAYGLLPAFCEELIFRSILCAEYERFGVGVAIAASALFFAMLHFSFPLFLTYLVLGTLLAGAMYATRSFFTALILHLYYNLFCLFGQPYLSAFYVRAGNNEIFLFCLVLILLLFAAFATGEARKIYHVYARNNADSSYAPKTSLRGLPQAIFRSLLSPAAGICLVLWLVISIVNLL